MRITQLRQADLNLLVVFTVLAEERHVSRAATRLLLSQPAVSRALQRLREMFHDDLLVRTANGYEPTPQGERIIQELEIMLPKLDRLLSGSSFDPAIEEATFRIAATDNATAVLAPLLCRRVLPKAGKVRFDFIAWSSDAFEKLQHGSIDLVLIGSLVNIPSSLQSQMIYQEEFVCVADSKCRYKDALTITQYIKADHVSISIQGGIQVVPDKPLADMGYKRKIAIQVPYFEAAMRCVCGTELVATMPRQFIEGMPRSKAVKVLKPPPEIKGFRYMMIWHPRVNSDAAHAWLRSTMRQMGEFVSS